MLKGYKTYIGIVVALAGLLGVAKFLGVQKEATDFLNEVIQVAGLLFATYGRYQANNE